MMLLHGLLSRRLGLGKEFGFFVYGQSGVLSLSVISELLRITNPPSQLRCLNLNSETYVIRCDEPMLLREAESF